MITNQTRAFDIIAIDQLLVSSPSFEKEREMLLDTDEGVCHYIKSMCITLVFLFFRSYLL